MGFTVSPEEAREWLTRRTEYAEVLKPYLSADDVLSRSDLSPSRWVIDFQDWSLHQAARYAELLGLVETRVRPEREAARGRNPIATQRADRWWQFASYTKSLYDAIGPAQYVVVVPNTSKYATPARVPAKMIFSNSLVVFAVEDHSMFGVLTSSLHWTWAVTYGSTLETRTRYGPSDCYETFALPPLNAQIQAAGNALDQHRAPS